MNAIFDPLGDFLVARGDVDHDRLRVNVRHTVGERPRIFGALSPILGIVDMFRAIRQTSLRQARLPFEPQHQYVG